MENLQRSLPGIHPQARSFDFFFDRLDTCLRKGRGFSLFQADAACVTDFSEQCERRGMVPFTIQLSSVQTGAGEIPAAPGFVTIVQDLPYADFMERAAVIADRIVFPLWFRRVPICFFSWLGREAYVAQPIKGEDLHRDFALVIRALLAEQALTLLERSNTQIASPELLDPGAQKILFTPIEEKIQAALEAHKLSYQMGVRLGRQTVDFLVQAAQDKQVIVECESKGYHEPIKDTEREKAHTLAGYPLCRFSGSEIEADVEKCIRTVLEAVHYRTLPAHQMDSDLDPSQREAV